MDQTRPCGCKGRRSCLICEAVYNIKPEFFITAEQKEKGYTYCHLCKKAWPGWDEDPATFHPNHQGTSIPYPGIYILPNFLSDTEKEALLEGIESKDWDLSQSGRRKQNYGPKCNFRRNKIQSVNFFGFPKFSKFVQDKFNELPILKDFQVIEQCSLEYDPRKGASIDPHIDDCWIWGERVVTVNVLGDTFLTMTKFDGSAMKYNLNQVACYPSVLNEEGHVKNRGSDNCSYQCNLNLNDDEVKPIVRILMPEKSLIVLFGQARYEWEHSVLREDIKSRRVCLAYREFTPPYLPGGKHENIGAKIIELSKIFW